MYKLADILRITKIYLIFAVKMIIFN